MKFIAEIDIMPMKSLLDPQGKAVSQSLKKIGFHEISHVRIGKHITLEIESDSKEKAMERLNESCHKILTNPIIEGYSYTLHEKKEDH